MNQYIAYQDGSPVGAISDDINLHNLAMQTLGIWLQAGLTVRLLKQDAPKSPPIKEIKPTPAPAKAASKPKPKAKPAKTAPVTWTAGQRAYLVWNALADDAQVHLSQYRNIAGVVAETRGGSGVQKTVGVRWNNDPDVIWLRPGEISLVPEV